jgi:hypothetical protein
MLPSAAAIVAPQRVEDNVDQPDTAIYESGIHPRLFGGCESAALYHNIPASALHAEFRRM